MLARVGADALVLEAVVELAEIDLDVLRRVGPGRAAQAHAPIRMGPLEMHRVDRVLLALEPVARNFGLDDLAEAVLPREEFPIRHQGSRRRPEIGPDEATQFGDRISLDPDLVPKPGLGMGQILVRLREADSRVVVEPAVIIAAQTAALDIAVAEVGAAMPAMPVEKAISAAEILVEHKIFAHEPHRLRPRLVELAGAGDRPPVAAQQFAHRRPGAGRRQNVPAAVRLKLAIVRHHGSHVVQSGVSSDGYITIARSNLPGAATSFGMGPAPARS
jgi:hypothetical protein